MNRPCPRPSFSSWIEKAFVETIPIEREPAEDRIQFREHTLKREHQREAGEDPAQADVEHVGMRFARAGEEVFPAVPAPRGDAVEQGEPHAGAFVRKTAKLVRLAIQFRHERRQSVLFERAVITPEEGTADLLQAVAHTSRSLETTPGKRGFLGRNPENQFTQAHSQQTITATASKPCVRLRRRASRY